MSPHTPENFPVKKVESLIRDLLIAIGENPDEDRIKDTPARVARWWKEFTTHDPGSLGTVFQTQAADQMVIVSGMRVWSLCEHHLLPFWAEVSIAYIPEGKVLGLSKFARVAHKHAHRLQIQERMVEGIAQEIVDLTGSQDVAVLARGEHLCATMRGVRTELLMTSSSLHGAFRHDPSCRAEFMSLATQGPLKA